MQLVIKPAPRTSEDQKAKGLLPVLLYRFAGRFSMAGHHKKTAYSNPMD